MMKLKEALIPENMRVILEKFNDAAIGQHDNAYYVELGWPVTDEGPELRTAVKIKNDKGLKITCSTLDPLTLRKADPDAMTSSKTESEILAAAIKDWEMLAIVIAIISSDPKLVALAEIAMADGSDSSIMNLITSFNPEELEYINTRDNWPNIAITAIKADIDGPSKIIREGGGFSIFKRSKTKKASVKLTVEDAIKKFRITEGRTFSYEEKKMMYQIPGYYELSGNVISIAEKIKASWSRPAHLHKINVLMEGPNGTGKTQDSKVLATLLGLPYTKQTCFADMDNSDITETFLPVAKQKYIPSEDEIMFDPVGTYKILTGTTKPDVTEDEIREAVANQNTEPEYIQFPSEIVRAFEFGYLCEIQEPTCIRDAAVLMTLASALEPDGVLNLSTRTVKRHPDCVIVLTTNPGYEGCRPLNQALRDRASIVKYVKMPEESELVKRLEKATSCKDKKFLRNVVKMINRFNDELNKMGIVASCSLRGGINFVTDVMDGFDLKESFYEDILYKITTNDEDLAVLETFLNQAGLGEMIYNA